MAKLLVFILVLGLAYLVIRHLRKPSPPSRPPAPPAMEDMVRCARCGLHLPRAEALAGEDGEYCCEDHRRQGRPR